MTETEKLLRNLEDHLAETRQLLEEHDDEDPRSWIIQVGQIIVDHETAKPISLAGVGKLTRTFAEEIAPRFANGLDERGRAVRFTDYCRTLIASGEELIDRIKNPKNEVKK